VQVAPVVQGFAVHGRGQIFCALFVTVMSVVRMGALTAGAHDWTLFCTHVIWVCTNLCANGNTQNNSNGNLIFIRA